MTRTKGLFTLTLFVFFGDVYLVLHTRNLIIIVAVLVKSCASFNLGNLFFHFLQYYCVVYNALYMGDIQYMYISVKREFTIQRTIITHGTDKQVL